MYHMTSTACDLMYYMAAQKSELTETMTIWPHERVSSSI